MQTWHEIKLFIYGKSFTVNDINNIPFPTDEIATITTDTHVFFSSVVSPFGNFYSCQFTVDDVDYCSVEQYYQSAKAAFANDAAAEAHIMSVSDPVDMLWGGKRVDIDQAAWADEEQTVMKTALRERRGIFAESTLTG